MSSIQPQKAVVRPRAFSPTSGDSLPLDEIVGDLLADGRYREIQIVGKPGGGKTTALRHLAAVLPTGNAVFLDDGSPEAVAKASVDSCVIFAHYKPRESNRRMVLTLAPWTDDELVECVLALYPAQCASVMSRLQSAADKSRLTGNPTLWRLVLGEFAADPELTSLRLAVLHSLESLLLEKPDRSIAGQWCLAILLRDDQSAIHTLQQIATSTADFDRLRPLRHSFVQHLLAAEHLCEQIAGQAASGWLLPHLPQSLVAEVGLHVRGNDSLQRALETMLDANRQQQPMAASILLAADGAWRPPTGMRLDLANGFYARASWPGLSINSTEKVSSNLKEADFSHADLSGSTLDWANASRASFSQAKLTKAFLEGLYAFEASFASADLSHANLDQAYLRKADLRRACLDHASLIGVELDHADLRRATFRGANLAYSVLLECTIAGADFTGANLQGIVARGLSLRKATLRGATFREADLSHCDLEGVPLAQPCFFQATLEDARLTGSDLPGADFRSANLQGAKLADIHWENADLRGAHLRGCTFHMGSTRSGLVGSPYPGHGSKTGFYTDDYYDQGYKRPEEIRKANLCGADLRGAKLDGVDFYLVDLRGAKFNPEIADHLHKCGAILVDHGA